MVGIMIFAVVVLLCICLFCILRIKQLQARLDAAKKSDKVKSVFIKAFGREIRTPLHSVSGLAEVISQEGLYLSKGEKKSLTDQIMYNTSMISTLLDELAIYTEDENGGHKLQDERFSPNQLCQRCMDANRSFAQKNVKLTFRHDLSDSFIVSAERHIIEVIVNKLVFSACKFTKEGEVAVGCAFREPARLLTFYVEDTGKGIPQDRKGELFTWFDHPDDIGDDTEFDLSVAQRLAAKLGGFLNLDESYQQGTRMEFTLPVR